MSLKTEETVPFQPRIHSHKFHITRILFGEYSEKNCVNKLTIIFRHWNYLSLKSYWAREINQAARKELISCLKESNVGSSIKIWLGNIHSSQIFEIKSDGTHLLRWMVFANNFSKINLNLMKPDASYSRLMRWKYSRPNLWPWWLLQVVIHSAKFPRVTVKMAKIKQSRLILPYRQNRHLRKIQ